MSKNPKNNHLPEKAENSGAPENLTDIENKAETGEVTAGDTNVWKTAPGKAAKIDLPEEEAQPRAEEASAAPVPAGAEADEEAAPAAGAEEKQGDEPAAEEEYSAADGTDASLLSEFAPKPINIPHVDMEKEKRRQEKRRKNRKKEREKVEARKKRSKKKASAGQRVAMGLASFLLFLVFSVTMTGFISVFSAQLATSKYAFQLAVKNMDIAEIPLGGIDDYAALGLRENSRRAALVDMIRDNAGDNVFATYSEIKAGIRSSGAEDFISDQLKAASDYLLLDKPYSPATGSDIAAVIKDSASLIRNLTGRELSDMDYAAIAAHFDNSGKMEDISRSSLDATKLRTSYTKYTKNLLSVNILLALLLVNIMLIVLLYVLGRPGSSGHIPIGWGFIISGLAVIGGAIFMFRPAYETQSQFLQAVLNNYFNFFTTTVVVMAGIFTVVGAFIFLVGNAASDKDE